MRSPTGARTFGTSESGVLAGGMVFRNLDLVENEFEVRGCKVNPPHRRRSLPSGRRAALVAHWLHRSPDRLVAENTGLRNAMSVDVDRFYAQCETGEIGGDPERGGPISTLEREIPNGQR